MLCNSGLFNKNESVSSSWHTSSVCAYRNGRQTLETGRESHEVWLHTHVNQFTPCHNTIDVVIEQTCARLDRDEPPTVLTTASSPFCLLRTWPVGSISFALPVKKMSITRHVRVCGMQRTTMIDSECGSEESMIYNPCCSQP